MPVFFTNFRKIKPQYEKIFDHRNNNINDYKLQPG